MTDMNRQERIRIRAHEIWERQGRPEGRHEEHWLQAVREIEMEDEDAAGLQRTLTETIGLAVGMEPEQGQAAGQQPSEPAEGDRGIVERELSRTKGTTAGGKAARPGKAGSS